MEASGCFDDTLPTTNERDKKRHWVGPNVELQACRWWIGMGRSAMF